MIIRRSATVLFRGVEIANYVDHSVIFGAVAVQDSAIRISSTFVNVYGFIHCEGQESSFEAGGAGVFVGPVLAVSSRPGVRILNDCR
jgi:hypothetical protein